MNAVAPVHADPVVCWPWHLRNSLRYDGHPCGANCRHCTRDVAIDRRLASKPAICLYCAMGIGLVDWVEKPLVPMAERPSQWEQYTGVKEAGQ